MLTHAHSEQLIVSKFANNALVFRPTHAPPTLQSWRRVCIHSTTYTQQIYMFNLHIYRIVCKGPTPLKRNTHAQTACVTLSRVCVCVLFASCGHHISHTNKIHPNSDATRVCGQRHQNRMHDTMCANNDIICVWGSAGRACTYTSNINWMIVFARLSR